MSLRVPRTPAWPHHHDHREGVGASLARARAREKRQAYARGGPETTSDFCLLANVAYRF